MQRIRACLAVLASVAASSAFAMHEGGVRGKALSESLSAARALDAEARAVDAQYSTKPVRVFIGTREYIIPANYFGPKGRDLPDFMDANGIGYFGFHLFLPEFGGYTKDNWKDKFDPNLVQILQVKSVDKAAGDRPDGHSQANPATYGEPIAQFRNVRRLLEEKPSLRAYGLQGYRTKHGNADVTWTGTRSNGEFFFFRCDQAPGDSARAGIAIPQCDVRYYSEKEDLFVAYRYSNANLNLWRRIDDAVWAALGKWRVK